MCFCRTCYFWDTSMKPWWFQPLRTISSQLSSTSSSSFSILWWEAVKQRQGLEAISVQPRLTLPLQQCICTPSLPHTLPHHHCHTVPNTATHLCTPSLPCTVPHNATQIATHCHTHLCRTPSLPHNYMLASSHLPCALCTSEHYYYFAVLTLS